ncbi:Membrane-anchored ubiquitin-fold protein 3 [Monoraphidium neglectum]|uniref:Membrane-anchored ubiquitin-fold protein 3 n=1 Tax=Monoraphidium neglectum TaxID=145388 RepID=A0A0D2MQ87_9CHLO|nr:Membrane-anchored ubiquitin-fold protein 3 [Monoraphidium neglectum]KIZ02597.1 Membrane-anchored ubiquitin-fold protein 3 [Monoraphidium neglectum]|eukprot:XP_013901616.1 Membrane-anchored ubiquitin-fold protein 3 [Monoraphidium neglectum]
MEAFDVQESFTVQQVKEAAFTQWPTEGPLSKENPTTAADLRLLCAGKFLENSKTLKEYRKEMGDPEAGTIVTMHVLVRPAQAGKAASKQPEAEKKAKSGCACVIC